ncbi:LysR family transcriptional regulator [Legionella spiritensis]|uniref:LysR family transcriptional regulator n=1 Tax=Legionella spiritensis TaxID=452 RepID=UPI000F6F3DE0|nr:LysR family transcriptional regulator [Legionella spiritensis]VEG92406.1 transcriptional regulator [Legionella spiritensis]
MNTIALMRTFCKVVQHRGFHAAAKSINLSAAAVSKQISLLESELGVTLFERTTRKVTLTTIGEAYYQEVQRVLLAVERANNLVASSRAIPGGLIRVKSSRYFAEHFILPRVAAFQKAYPDIRLDLQIAEQVPHLLEEELDIVFGMSMSVASNSIRKKITSTRYILCASPAYLAEHGQPEEISDLTRYDYITHSMRQPNNSWTFASGETIVFEPALYLNDATSMAYCVEQGMGIAALHHYQIAEALRDGRLVEILPGFRMPVIPVFLYYHPARFIQPKIKVWIEWMGKDIPEEI